MSKILITGTSVSDEFLKPLREAGFDISNPAHLLSEDGLCTALQDATAYLLGGDEVATRTVLSQSRSLKVIAFLGVGYESFIDTAAAKEFGISVTNTPGTLTESVAEFTVGQLVHANRRFTEYTNSYRHGNRDSESKQTDLVSRRIGIIGLGVIGTRIVEILTQGFGASVTYFSRTRKPAEEVRLGISYTELEKLAENSDVLIVMTPGNSSTKGLVSHDILSRLPSGALLINTARPEVVDPSALRCALQDGQISVAVYDNFYEEPEGSALLEEFQEDRLLVTGHISSLTHEARDGMARKAVNSILNIVDTGTDECVFV